MMATRPLLVALAVMLTTALLASVPTRAVALEERQVAPGAESAIVIDAATGAVLFERNARVGMHPASLTKMMTALTAVERAPLDRVVKVTHEISVTPILIGLEPGDELPLDAILYGLLLNSGNDAALAIAESVGDGSTGRFVGWMNVLAGRLGLSTAHFENPHGLDAENHLASAYDLAIIGRALMREPFLAKVVSEPRHEYDGAYRWVFRSRNPLLGVYDGVDGIKTGFDDLAGLCLVATASRDGHRAIAVVMKSTGFGADAASLLDYAFENRRLWPEPAAPADGRRRMPGSRLGMLRADVSTDGTGAPSQLLGSLGTGRATTDRGPS